MLPLRFGFWTKYNLLYGIFSFFKHNFWLAPRWKSTGPSTAWKVFKYGIFSGPYFPAFVLNTERYFVSLSVFSPNVGKYWPEKTPYLDNFHAVQWISFVLYFPSDIFEFSFNPQCKIGWSTGHVDGVFSILQRLYPTDCK